MLRGACTAPFLLLHCPCAERHTNLASQKPDMSDFRPQAPSAETVFLRTYSRRKEDGARENFEEAMLRTVNDIAEIGKYDQEEYALVRDQALPFWPRLLGRWHRVG